MTVLILLLVDFALLSIVLAFYLRRVYKERQVLLGKAGKSYELQQQMYQVEVLQEINERIGYSLEGNKVIEIITNSLGNLLEYETVSFMLYNNTETVVFKCHVHQSVNHRFISQVKEHMRQATEVVCGGLDNNIKLDERIGGALLQDHLDIDVKSYVNIPVVIGNELLGLINLSSSKPDLFDHNQASVLFNITNQAAVAVGQLQTMLESEKGKLTGIIAAMTDGVMMVDLDNTLEIYNPAVVDLLSLPVGRAITMFDILDSLAGKVDLRTKIEQALAKGVPVEVKEVLLHDKAMEITITPVRDHAGNQRGAAVILHDVTSEKSLEKLRQEFTAMMVHELRAPLTAVRWSAESLLKHLSDAKAQLESASVKDSVSNIDIAATNMLELVNDLLDVAKIEAGKFDLNIQEYDLSEIISEEVNTFKAQADSKHLPMNFITPGPVKVKCDKVRIGQVISNLLSNAIKYTDAGQIDIHLSKDVVTNQVVVAVKDTGLGVSREDLAVLFSKFKQLKTFDRTQKGTGLGLVVSRGIVEAHHGRIWAESAGENLGSTFSFSLPLK
ncbi:MAG TPA: ATP-binding protein [Candidatus Doudnabacteria bacterium]|nr:ATP-binding protein [Candidatus Doudnabacteria bacterium]